MRLRLVAVLFVILLLNTGYVAAFASPTIFYIGNVLLHLGLGIVFTAIFLIALRRTAVAGRICLLLAAVAGIWLAWFGNTLPHRPVLYAHIALGALFTIWAVRSLSQARDLGGQFKPALIASAGFAVLLPLITFGWHKLGRTPVITSSIRRWFPCQWRRKEADQKSVLAIIVENQCWPTIPSDFFMDSKLCCECHKRHLQPVQ